METTSQSIWKSWHIQHAFIGVRAWTELGKYLPSFTVSVFKPYNTSM